MTSTNEHLTHFLLSIVSLLGGCLCCVKEHILIRFILVFYGVFCFYMLNAFHFLLRDIRRDVPLNEYEKIFKKRV